MDISLQLWSIKEEVEEDFARALELTAKAGYQGVEFAGYHGKSPAQLGELLAKYNLKAVSTHVGMERLHTALDEEIEYAKALGYRLIVCPWSECKTREQVIEDAKFLEVCAGKVLKEGIAMGYHNHNQEFRKFGGRYAMDIMLEHMPSVKFEPDLFWISYGLVDPVRYLKPLAAAGRLAAIHAKELDKEGPDNVYIGQGKIDFAGIAAICPPGKYPWIVEQEEFSSDHFDGILKSYQGLRKIIG
ncbi:MAG: sugar phosphate isomerase/epimerase [Spirochaetaceae bacterium]|jgi:sugar phosphate isomerase/epimerase|nr:sugar phosphate isomerase/epimerase [Spirochaetaceae bacterium]